ncbi:MAG: hypothetical protein HN383_06350 [Verrucomicrobia bacterium]|jgi:hypothetical protein|nr:hypothetical protein [Verrucomicrobiota bacterium]MBT7699808.1 hypothetical protein [Verrucomicrobiota bacterium]
MKLMTAWALLTTLACCAQAQPQDGVPTRLPMSRPESSASDFYKDVSIFTMRASETASKQTIDRFGPVGMSIDLLLPPFVMQIGLIEEGSPAAVTGKLKAGQFIETINGQKLADVDPRIQLAALITEAEASDGILTFMIREQADSEPFAVDVQLPVLGAYSETWPLDCPKSDRIVRDFADYLAESGWGDGRCELNGPAMLFLLSTGEEKDLDVVREWIKTTIAFYAANPAPFKNWRLGYGGISLAEYYLRTGDKAILPVIQKYADVARDHHYLGGWAHGGTGLFKYMNGGHMNAAGTHVLAFLLLAKECGVDVDERTLQSSLTQFYRFAGRGLTPYGDGLPENLFVDNGRCGKLALAMAAATALTPDGEDSLYARARDVAAFKGFTTTPWMNHGHTGGGVGEVWRSMVMGMLYEKRPKQYRSFMKERQWFYELSRRHDGSFGILNGGRYDGRPGSTPEWGHAMGLTYTAPRKTLRITGAPRTRYGTAYELPARPWGTAADDAFLSLSACMDKNGRIPAVEEETLDTSCSQFILMKLNEDSITEDEVRYFAHHQEIAIRRLAAYCAAGMKPQYMRQQKPEQARFPGLVTELLQSADPRVRHAGIMAVSQLPSELLIGENAALIAGMITDPDESWFVTARALTVLQHADPAVIAAHLDRLLELAEHDEWWLRQASLAALMPIMTDTRYYAKILPVVSRVIASNQRYSTLHPLRALGEKLEAADPKVQQAAVEMLGAAYVSFSQEMQTREVPNLDGETRHLDLIAGYLAPSPGGLDELFKAVQSRFPDAPLRHRSEFLRRQESASPAVQKALQPIILDELVPEHVGRNYTTLVRMRDLQHRGGFAGGRGDAMDELVNLYRSAGMQGYDWHNVGPDLRQAEFWYHTFDPIAEEQVPWDQLVSRFRRVTMPEGMEKWYTQDFDPAAAGWKRGRAAFGNYDGEIPDHSDSGCVGEGAGCKCGATVHTLWDKEVLLFSGTFTMPELKPGYRYRLRVNEGDHVGCGGGYEVYINGTRIANAGRPPKRGQGGLPKGAFITEEWIEKLSGKPFTIAIKSFIRYNRSYQHKPTSKLAQGRISVHFEEMKMPPFSYDQVIQSASLVPMESAEWQANQFAGLEKGGDSEADARQGSMTDGKFSFDGTFRPNPAVHGTWVMLGQVAEVNEFVPGQELAKELPRGRPPFKEIIIKEGGRTSEDSILWSGDRMMNLSRFEALRMVFKQIDGTDYLFIEAGNFQGPTGLPVGWQSPWSVMKRK